MILLQSIEKLPEKHFKDINIIIIAAAAVVVVVVVAKSLMLNDRV